MVEEAWPSGLSQINFKRTIRILRLHSFLPPRSRLPPGGRVDRGAGALGENLGGVEAEAQAQSCLARSLVLRRGVYSSA